MRLSLRRLARRCNADEEALPRFVQHAVTKRFLGQPEACIISHAAFSAMMAAQPPVSDFVGYLCEDLHPAAMCIPDALTKWSDSPKQPTKTGHNLASGITGTFWDYLVDIQNGLAALHLPRASCNAALERRRSCSHTIALVMCYLAIVSGG